MIFFVKKSLPYATKGLCFRNLEEVAVNFNEGFCQNYCPTVRIVVHIEFFRKKTFFGKDIFDEILVVNKNINK